MIKGSAPPSKSAAAVRDTMDKLRPRLEKMDIKNKLKRRSGSLLLNTVRYALIISLSFLILLPILKQLAVIIKDPYELGFPVSVWIPGNFSLEHLVVGFKLLNYPMSLPYTLFSTTILMLIQTIFSAFAGYSFARMKFRGSNILFACVLLTIIVPPQALMLPQYIYFQNFDILGIFKLFTGSSLNLLNSPATLYLLSIMGMGLKNGLYIYIYRQFFRGLPKELEEAAFVDGAGFLRTFASIVMPASRSSITTVAVLSFVWNWNDTYYVNLFNPSMNNLMIAMNDATSAMDQAIKRVASVAGNFPASYALNNSNPLYQSAVAQSASLLVMLPLIVLFLLVQKQFIQSAERSGIVG